MADIKALVADVESKLAAARALHETGTHAKNQEASALVEAAKQALSDGVAEGAKPCPTCGAKVHGMIQQTMVRKQLTPIFEIGCVACRDHRAQGFTPSLAVLAFNTGEWLDPSPGPGVNAPGGESREKQVINAADVGVLEIK